MLDKTDSLPASFTNANYMSCIAAMCYVQLMLLNQLDEDLTAFVTCNCDFDNELHSRKSVQIRRLCSMQILTDVAEKRENAQKHHKLTIGAVPFRIAYIRYEPGKYIGPCVGDSRSPCKSSHI